MSQQCNPFLMHRDECEFEFEFFFLSENSRAARIFFFSYTTCTVMFCNSIKSLYLCIGHYKYSSENNYKDACEKYIF